MEERNQEAPAKSETLELLVDNEVAEGKKKASEGLLWLMRGLDFTCLALKGSLEKPTEQLSSAFKQAYGQTLSSHHGFLARSAFNVRIYPLTLF